MPPPYDVHNFLDLLGIHIDDPDAEHPTGRFTVTHPLIAGTGYLWAPVATALADALCAFGVGGRTSGIKSQQRTQAGQLHPILLASGIAQPAAGP